MTESITTMLGKDLASELYLKNGGRLDFWVRNHAMLQRVVEDFRLQPLAEAAMQQMAVERIHTVRDAATPVNLVRHINGGNKAPHLHLDGKMYLLTDDQWKAVSHQAIERFQKKLAKISEGVNFETTLALAEVIDAA